MITGETICFYIPLIQQADQICANESYFLFRFNYIQIVIKNNYTLEQVSQTKPLKISLLGQKKAHVQYRLMIQRNFISKEASNSKNDKNFQLKITCQNILVWVKTLESLGTKSEYPVVRKRVTGDRNANVTKTKRGMYKITRLKFIRICC